MEFHLQTCFKDDIEGIEKIGLDLVGIRDHTPYPAKKRIGLQGIDFLRDDLWGGAAEIMVADLHVILFFSDHGIAVDDLLAQGNVRIVGVEILLRIVFRIVVEQSATPFQQIFRLHMPGVEQGGFQGFVYLPFDVQQRCSVTFLEKIFRTWQVQGSHQAA